MMIIMILTDIRIRIRPAALVELLQDGQVDPRELGRLSLKLLLSVSLKYASKGI